MLTKSYPNLQKGWKNQMDNRTNIVLIGMPGCGKTEIGRSISEQLSMDYFDIDKYIENSKAKTINEIFEHGEEYFRDIESDAVKKISLKCKSVISTGGGTVKRRINIDNLKKSGYIFFIDRPLDNIKSDIDTSGRPLLKNKLDRIDEIYNERYKLYTEYCDYIIKNDKKINDAVNDIAKIYRHITNDNNTVNNI